MEGEVEQLRAELTSPDASVRNWAAVWAGNYGAGAVELLPLLLDIVQHKLYDSRPMFHCGEFVSIGRILRSADKQIDTGLATSHLVWHWEATLDRILTLLESARGPSAQLLVYALALAGPRAARAACTIARVAVASQDRVMHKRAYQFAYSVQPHLLAELPWYAFISHTEAERARTELDSALTAYND